MAIFTPKGCGWRLEKCKAARSVLSGASVSPSSLDRRPPSPAVVVIQLWGAGAGFVAEVGVAAGGRGVDMEAVEPGALGWMSNIFDTLNHFSSCLLLLGRAFICLQRCATEQ